MRSELAFAANEKVTKCNDPRFSLEANIRIQNKQYPHRVRIMWSDNTISDPDTRWRISGKMNEFNF